MLVAPVGVLALLSSVPDPAFSDRLVGDGIAIDPVTDLIVAPCQGVVAQVHSAGHAVTIRTDGGVEVLIHVGLDTVMLKGRGFTPRVRAGDDVRPGETLLSFNADLVATQARSLLTEMVVTTMEGVTLGRPRTGMVTAGRDEVLEVWYSSTTPEAVVVADGASTIASDPIVISNPTGLHARPAAVIAARARQFKSGVRLVRGDRSANAKSLTSLMALEVAAGDTVIIEASGDDASQAVAVLGRVVVDEARDSLPADTAARQSGVARVALTGSLELSADPKRLTGVAASPGVALGEIFQWRQQDAPVIERAGDQLRERRELDARSPRRTPSSMRSSSGSLPRRMPTSSDLRRAQGTAGGSGSARCRASTRSSAARRRRFAWQQAYREQADRLGRCRNEMLAARAGDIRDVGRRVLRILTGGTTSAPPRVAR